VYVKYKKYSNSKMIQYHGYETQTRIILITP